MGWHKIPEFESVSSSDDHPFAGSRIQPTGEVSVKLPVDDWLCKKMDKLNLAITERYPARNSDTDGMRCILIRSVRVTLYAPGLWNRPSSTIHLAELPDVVFPLPHHPGPSARTFLGVGREQPVNKLSCATLEGYQDA